MDAKVEYLNNIGKQVKKISGKPFQSGSKTNTVNSIGLHPITGRFVYTFEEDSSFVECKQCVGA